MATPVQEVIIERLLNTRFTLAGGNVSLDANPNVWTHDILDAYANYPGGADDANNEGTYAAGPPATYTVPNAHWRPDQFVGRYLVDRNGYSFAITSNREKYVEVDPDTGQDDRGNPLPTGTEPTPGVGWVISTKRVPPGNPVSGAAKHEEWLLDPNSTGRPHFKDLNLLDIRSIRLDQGEPDSRNGNAPDHGGRRPRGKQVEFLEDAINRSGDGRDNLALLGADNLIYEVLNKRLQHFHKESAIEALFDLSDETHRLIGVDPAPAPIPSPITQAEWAKINKIVHWYIDNHLGVHGPEQHEFY